MKKVEHYNVIIDGRNFFNQLTKNGIRTYDNILKFATGQGDDYTTGCSLDYFKKHCKMIPIDLSKKQAFGTNSKAIQQTNFTGNLSGNKSRLIFFLIEEGKKQF